MTSYGSETHTGYRKMAKMPSCLQIERWHHFFCKPFKEIK